MHRAFSFSVKVTTIVLLVLGVAGFAFAEPVVTLFRRSDPEVIRTGTETFPRSDSDRVDVGLYYAEQHVHAGNWLRHPLDDFWRRRGRACS